MRTQRQNNWSIWTESLTASSYFYATVFLAQEIARHLRPKTLRAMFGKNKIQNAVHCTDLPEDGVLEVEYFFRILNSWVRRCSHGGLPTVVGVPGPHASHWSVVFEVYVSAFFALCIFMAWKYNETSEVHRHPRCWMWSGGLCAAFTAFRHSWLCCDGSMHGRRKGRGKAPLWILKLSVKKRCFFTFELEKILPLCPPPRKNPSDAHGSLTPGSMTLGMVPWPLVSWPGDLRVSLLTI